MPPPPGISARRQAQRVRLEEVEAQLHELQCRIHALETERDELKDDLSSIVYPILTIPNEITSEIFEHCLPVGNRRGRPRCQTAPLLLTAICRHFRQVCLATPALWTSINLDLPRGWAHTTNKVALGKGVAELVGRWFTRTGSCPLSFTLRGINSQTDSYILRALADFSSQWHHLDLDVQSQDFTHLAQIDGPFPMLRRLAIPSHLTSDLVHFRDIPSLSEIRILHKTPASPVKIGMAGLTSLQIDQVVKFSTFVKILRRCPRLLHLDVAVRAPGQDQGLLPISHLQSLTLRPSAGSTALAFLTLPELKQLRISSEECRILVAFVVRSSCSVDHLGLLNISENDSADIFLQCLQAIPKLASLELHFRERRDFDEWGPKYRLLTRSDVLPNLTTLKISESDADSRWRFDFLIAILTARMEHNSRLVDLEMHIRDDNYWSDYHILGIYQHFDWLIARGLRVRIKHVSAWELQNGEVAEDDYVLVPDIGRPSRRWVEMQCSVLDGI
ncbi:hypothetical protein FB451DRAFT_1398406 [Mycena latifolia]|nr:hypothetical protein FB451DRAFT_1398406 [Mycena latifolia]